MTTRDQRLADKYRAQGRRSATETSREKEAASRTSTSAPTGGIFDALRNFDKDRPNETAVPRSEESKQRARASKWKLPRLG